MYESHTVEIKSNGVGCFSGFGRISKRDEPYV
jgi:hypothetical protein